MLFIKSDELKTGMRLAKPIYNKNGVMLYERNSKLTRQGIVSIQNFGLIGVYILEPAEPVPPMSEDDIEFVAFSGNGDLLQYVISLMMWQHRKNQRGCIPLLIR